MTDGTFVTPGAGRAHKRDVYLFFDNTEKLKAPDNARTMMGKMSERTRRAPS